MKISKVAIKKISDSLSIQGKIADALKKSWKTIERWVEDNEDNGALTSAAVIQIIKTETGLSESEILIETKVSV